MCAVAFVQPILKIASNESGTRDAFVFRPQSLVVCHDIHVSTRALISGGPVAAHALPRYFWSVTSAERDVISGACSCGGNCRIR